MREKTSKKFLIVAVVLSVIVVAVFCAALFLDKGGATNGDADVSGEISQILESEEAVKNAVLQKNLSEYSTKIDEISEILNKIDASGVLKDEVIKTKLEEAKNSFTKLKETGEFHLLKSLRCGLLKMGSVDHTFCPCQHSNISTPLHK